MRTPWTSCMDGDGARVRVSGAAAGVLRFSEERENTPTSRFNDRTWQYLRTATVQARTTSVPKPTSPKRSIS
ncbi:hypothetical protein ACFYY1_40790 [Streptomyces sp. NPDC001890]|uniref:hypothetical protein n=1 Tax=Streptomyces sp. NPDC001890 TaxID=3364620 RepID=UPI00368C5517